MTDEGGLTGSESPFLRRSDARHPYFQRKSGAQSLSVPNEH